MSADLAPGTVVQRYRLDGVIGRGGMGTVYRAVHLDSGRVMAIKAMHAEVAAKPPLRKRFLREARASMAVGHPSIVRIDEVFEHDGTPMLSMELLEGESLEATLQREGKIDLARLGRILVHVTSAVGTAHALGIVHRDIKPENIFLTRDEATPVKLLDFGIAKFTAIDGANAETAALTRTGALMGTPFYMSPEQAFGEKRIDQRADIWALGILIYRCLSGVLPTRGTSFAEVFRKVIAADFPALDTILPEVPAEVSLLVHRMLQRNADDRPWDLREVHAVLERYCQQSAPSFGMAVAPLWDEDSSVTGGPSDSSAQARPSVASAVPSKPLALTPSSLKLGATPKGTTPTGTIAMDPAPSPSRPLDAPLVAPAPRSRTWMFVVLAIAAVLFLGVAIALKLRGD